MNRLKSLSSKWIHDTYPGSWGFAWQAGYAVFSVSPSMAEQVIRYIDCQEAHHRRVTFEEEFVAFLKRHGVEYDPNLVFDKSSSTK